MHEVLEQDDLWLEVTHNYIQWLFPNRLPSRVTPDAPCLTDSDIQLFNEDELLRNHLRASLHRMLAFYGLQLSESALSLAANWDERKSNWWLQDTHNNLRITRVLHCLTACGLRDEAEKVLNGLLHMRETDLNCGVSENAFQYWKEAI